MVAPGYSKKLKSEFLKAHSTLVVDTRHFDARFTARLLEAMGDVADQTDGVVFHSENFQALSLMQARYREQVKCIYIDPPYNTDAGPIDYKNGYRSSSWMSMIQKRLSLSRALLSIVLSNDFLGPRSSWRGSPRKTASPSIGSHFGRAGGR
jgi:adenine-specific DNA-methyltransferase